MSHFTYVVLCVAILIGGISAIDLQELFTLDCQRTLHVLPKTPLAFGLKMDGFFKSVDLAMNLMEDMVKCECPQMSHIEFQSKFSPSPIMMHRFMKGSIGEEECQRKFNPYIDVVYMRKMAESIYPFDLIPTVSTCNEAEARNGRCKVAYNIPKAKVSLKVALDKCPPIGESKTNNIPFISVVCEGEDCSNLFKPCSFDSDCAPGRKCVGPPSTFSFDDPTVKGTFTASAQMAGFGEGLAKSEMCINPKVMYSRMMQFILRRYHKDKNWEQVFSRPMFCVPQYEKSLKDYYGFDMSPCKDVYGISECNNIASFDQTSCTSSVHGKCVDGKCICNPGYEGIACQNPTKKRSVNSQEKNQQESQQQNQNNNKSASSGIFPLSYVNEATRAIKNAKKTIMNLSKQTPNRRRSRQNLLRKFFKRADFEDECYGVKSGDRSVCGGYGECTGRDTCQCGNFARQLDNGKCGPINVQWPEPLRNCIKTFTDPIQSWDGKMKSGETVNSDKRKSGEAFPTNLSVEDEYNKNHPIPVFRRQCDGSFWFMPSHSLANFGIKFSELDTILSEVNQAMSDMRKCEKDSWTDLHQRTQQKLWSALPFLWARTKNSENSKTFADFSNTPAKRFLGATLGQPVQEQFSYIPVPPEQRVIMPKSCTYERYVKEGKCRLSYSGLSKLFGKKHSIHFAMEKCEGSEGVPAIALWVQGNVFHDMMKMKPCEIDSDCNNGKCLHLDNKNELRKIVAEKVGFLFYPLSKCSQDAGTVMVDKLVEAILNHLMGNPFGTRTKKKVCLVDVDKQKGIEFLQAAVEEQTSEGVRIGGVDTYAGPPNPFEPYNSESFNIWLVIGPVLGGLFLCCCLLCFCCIAMACCSCAMILRVRNARKMTSGSTSFQQLQEGLQ